MKKLSYLFIAIAILLSNIMCSVVAFNYRDMLCGIEHLGYSAPASVAFPVSYTHLTLPTILRV